MIYINTLYIKILLINYMKNTVFMLVRTRDIDINQISPMIPYDDVFHEPGMTATTIIDCMDDIAYALCNTLTKKSASDYPQVRNHDNLMSNAMALFSSPQVDSMT